jgi:hypothetical protein
MQPVEEIAKPRNRAGIESRRIWLRFTCTVGNLAAREVAAKMAALHIPAAMGPLGIEFRARVE